jgi:hypothetical protein
MADMSLMVCPSKETAAMSGARQTPFINVAGKPNPAVKMITNRFKAFMYCKSALYQRCMSW